MHTKNITTSGKTVADAGKALIMIHGRGGSAADILSLAAYLPVSHFALLAPEATGNSWYPYSFMAPVVQNEPYLSAALALINELVEDLVKAGMKKENIYFLGFSQGACLTLEFVARHATQYGGVVAFTGGLIGDELNEDLYKGNFNGTPIFIGTSDPDMHVPVQRVQATTKVLQNLGASVTEKIYPNMGHTITADEIALANQTVFKATSTAKGI